MTIQNGALVLIKIGNGAMPEVFTTIGGLHTSGMKLENQILNATNVESGAWKQLLGSAGIASLSISGSGLFTDSAAEATLMNYALAGSVNNYQFIFANGDMLSGPFLVTSYERSGDYGAEEIYSLALESAGTVTFTD
jgi:TP901-1 family phage major tail protein